MNPDLLPLHPYPFEKLHALKTGVIPPDRLKHIALSLGEPQHSAPDFISQVMQRHLDGLSRYPLTRGMDTLRETIRLWLIVRYQLPADSLDRNRHIIPLNGSREGLFSVAQAVVDRSKKNPLVLLPNPFYQIYEGAAFLAGATPYYYPTPKENHYAPDFEHIPDEVWRDCQLLFVCTPGNPTGHVTTEKTFRFLLKKVEEFNFTLVSDECYSEIYFDETKPPVGLLQVAQQYGYNDFKNCLVFNSLSKRSNLPGLRSGFVAGDPDLIKPFLHYRTYHGCAMSETTQHVSIAAWQDEVHVKQNRDFYRQKFSAVIDQLAPQWQITYPDAAFFLWAPTPIDDQQFARELFAQQHITVLPGSYLSRQVNGYNPGENHVRIALVAGVEECLEAAHRIQQFLSTL